jgi:hypothetical protein
LVYIVSDQCPSASAHPNPASLFAHTRLTLFARNKGDAGTDVTLTIRKKMGDGSPEKVTLTREATNVVPKKRVNDQEGGGGLFTVRTTFWLSQIPDDCLPILVPEGTIYYHCRLSARNYSYTWPYKTDTFLLQSRAKTPRSRHQWCTSRKPCEACGSEEDETSWCPPTSGTPTSGKARFRRARLLS